MNSSRYFFMGILLIVLGITSWNRTTWYVDETTLWGKTAQQSPRKARPHCNLGLSYLQSNSLREAQYHLEHALMLAPDAPDTLSNLANVYSRLGRDLAARLLLEDALRYNPGHLAARSNLAFKYYDAGLFVQALAEYRTIILQADPRSAEAGIAQKMINRIHQQSGLR